jgi:hypothetical protein
MTEEIRRDIIAGINYTEYRKDNNPHRANGPAVIWEGGNGSYWWLYGKRHRYYGSASFPTFAIWIHDVRIK